MSQNNNQAPLIKKIMKVAKKKTISDAISTKKKVIFAVESTSFKKKRERKNPFSKLNLVRSIESNNDGKKERRGREKERENKARAKEETWTEESGPTEREKEK